MPFTETWNALRANLATGTVIPNWTAHHGNLGDSFTIVEVDTAQIVVDTPGAKLLQHVPVADFEEIYNDWHDYTRRAKLRSDFTPLTRYSKYVISILHWLEQRSGALP